MKTTSLESLRFFALPFGDSASWEFHIAHYSAKLILFNAARWNPDIVQGNYVEYLVFIGVSAVLVRAELTWIEFSF